MNPHRIDAALERIEAAAERIAFAARQSARPAANSELARRHEKLRAEAGAALAQLDQLILELEN